MWLASHPGKKKEKKKEDFSLSASHNTVSDRNGCKSIRSKVKQFVLWKLPLCLWTKFVSDDFICWSLKLWFAECCSLLCSLCLLSDSLDWSYFLIQRFISAAFAKRSTLRFFLRLKMLLNVGLSWGTFLKLNICFWSTPVLLRSLKKLYPRWFTNIPSNKEKMDFGFATKYFLVNRWSIKCQKQ